MVRTGDRAVARHAQTVVHDAGGRHEGVRLRGEAYAHSRAGDDAIGGVALTVKVETLETEVARFGWTETAHVGGVIKTNGLVADLGAERVLGGVDRVFVSALGEGRSGDTPGGREAGRPGQ